MRGPHPNHREARAHRAPRALAPGYGVPRARRQVLGQGAHAEGTMLPRATDQRRRPTMTPLLRRWQRRAAGSPHGRLSADPHDVRNAVSGQRIAKRGHDAVAAIGDDGRGRDAPDRELGDLLERHLPFRAEFDGVGHTRGWRRRRSLAHASGTYSR
jgi:hypothetical protein